MVVATKNFLRASKSYVKKMKGINSDYDYLLIGDVIIKALNDNYPNVVFQSELLKIVNEAKISASTQAIGKITKQIELTRRWLLANCKKKEEVVNEINDFKTKSHRKFLLYGIESFEEDGIESIEQAEDILRFKDNPALRKNNNLISFENIFTSAMKHIDDLFGKMSSMKKNYDEVKNELVDCFDEIAELKSLVLEVKRLNRIIKEKEESLEERRKKCDKLEEKKAQLLKENKKLKDDIELILNTVEKLKRN